ncbi:MAG: DUF547 domain-containing protein [Cyanobacteria bacterium J06649_4]
MLIAAVNKTAQPFAFTRHLSRNIMTFKKNRFKKNYLLLALVPALIGLGGCAASPISRADGIAIAQTAEGTSASATVNTPAFAEVLSTYVNEQGLVDYDALQNDRQQLDFYNASIQLVDPATYDSWSEPEQIAFLINAYNSITLKSIIDESPIKDSIKDITGVWRFKRHGILQGEQTLNNIEHDILRKDFDEPRIHAALVCAAISCPYLRQEPFTGASLDAQLDDQVRTFISREEAFKIDRENNVVELSAIFDWFGQDWVPSFAPDAGFAGSDNEKAVLNFISGYLNEADKAYLEAGDYRVTYSDYDWSLNRQ